MAICIVSFGEAAYYAAAYESAASALAYTDAEILVLTDAVDIELPHDSRIAHLPVLTPERSSKRFMTKLEGWRACLNETEADVIVLLDADAVFVADAPSPELITLVRETDLAMVEQVRLVQLGWRKGDYWRHYCRTSLKAIDAHASPPSPENFRFFNAGFVISRRPGLERFLDWYREVALRVDFDQADRMGLPITDQDFVQFWSNNMHPELVSTLDWSWNHCSQWDIDFPRPGARVIHFSNFYRAPDSEVIKNMRLARTGESTGV